MGYDTAPRDPDLPGGDRHQYTDDTPVSQRRSAVSRHPGNPNMRIFWSFWRDAAQRPKDGALGIRDIIAIRKSIAPINTKNGRRPVHAPSHGQTKLLLLPQDTWREAIEYKHGDSPRAEEALQDPTLLMRTMGHYLLPSCAEIITPKIGGFFFAGHNAGITIASAAIAQERRQLQTGLNRFVKKAAVHIPDATPIVLARGQGVTLEWSNELFKRLETSGVLAPGMPISFDPVQQALHGH